jgi:hypothetical protein
LKQWGIGRRDENEVELSLRPCPCGFESHSGHPQPPPPGNRQRRVNCGLLTQWTTESVGRVLIHGQLFLLSWGGGFLFLLGRW